MPEKMELPTPSELEEIKRFSGSHPVAVLRRSTDPSVPAITVTVGDLCELASRPAQQGEREILERAVKVCEELAVHYAGANRYPGWAHKHTAMMEAIGAIRALITAPEGGREER